MTITTVLNLTVGENKNVARIWIEGAQLICAGIKIETKYRMVELKGRLELREADASYTGQTFRVCPRNRNGIINPLLEIRSNALRQFFKLSEKVRVAIRNGIISLSRHHLSTKASERCARMMTKLRDNVKLDVCSMFHGGGIMDKALHHGFKRAGIKTKIKVAIEYVSKYLNSSLRNNPELWDDDSVAVCSDIRDVNFHHNTPTCDLLFAGIPCTGASRAGAAKNNLDFAEEHKDAGTMFFDLLEGIKLMNPVITVLECVPEYLKSASMAVIRSVLTSLGYNLFEAVLDGNDFGVLEGRKRMVLVAVCANLPFQINLSGLESLKKKEECINQILEDVPLNDSSWKAYEHLAAKAVSDKEAGKGFAVRQLLTGAEGRCGTIGKGYAKGRSTEPFLIHPENSDLIRLFTEGEHAALKGIPKEVLTGNSTTTSQEICGQSVAYPKFEAVGFGIGCELADLYTMVVGKYRMVA